MYKKIEISRRSIAFLILFPLFLYFLWIIRELLFSLLIAFIIMSALRPLAAFLHRKGFPRQAAIFVVFFGFVLVFVSLVSLIVPPIFSETAAFLKTFPAYEKKLSPEITKYIDLSSFFQYVPSVTNNIFSIVGNVFSNVLFIITTLFFALYFLLEESLIRRFFGMFISESELEHYEEIVSHVESRLTGWFWGQITLMLIIGLLSYIGLVLIGIKYAVPLAVLAGLLEAVPTIGPILSAVPAILIGLSDSYLTGLFILILYFFIQQAENTLIVPIVMKRATGISPILILIALVIGGKIGGVLGVLLSIPMLIVGETIVREFVLHYRKKDGKSDSKLE
jgi:predicted PurR-regulated permease PerM